MFKNFKIKTKIILPITLTAAIILGAATFYSYSFNVKILTQAINEHLETTVFTRAHHVDTFLAGQKEKIKILSSISVFSKVLDATSSNYESYYENASNMIDEIVDSDQTIYELFIMDKEGQIIYSSDHKHVGLNKATDDYFINGLKGIYIKDVYFSETTQRASLAISAPIISSNSEHYGVIVARIGMSNLNKIVADKTGLGETGEIYIINKDGYVITPLKAKDDTFLKLKIESESAKKCLALVVQQKNKNYLATQKDEHNMHQISTMYLDYKGDNVLGAYHPSHVMDWCLFAEISSAEALAPTRDVLKFSIVRILSILLIFLLVTYFLARNISKPLMALHHGTKIIEKGDLSYRVKVDAKDEIGELVDSFNTMTMRLEKSKKNIKRKIAERTAELERLNRSMVGRELKMIELKKEIRQLQKNKK